MKKTQKSIYLRYEFTNEKGKMEGGDIFEYSSLAEAEAMVNQVLEVTINDGVAVNITVGEGRPFFGFLKGVGLTDKQVKAETVVREAAAASKKTAKKKTTKKKASKKVAKR